MWKRLDLLWAKNTIVFSESVIAYDNIISKLKT